MYILTKVLHCLWGCIKPNIHISSCVGHRSGRAEPFPWNYVFTCNAKAFRVRDVEHFFFFFLGGSLTCVETEQPCSLWKSKYTMSDSGSFFLVEVVLLPLLCLAYYK